MAQVTKSAAKKSAAKSAPAKGATKSAAKGATTGKAIGKVTPPAGPVQPKETAAAAAPAKGKGAAAAPAKGKGAAAEKAPAKPRGADRPYTLVSKDNPFREGTIRADLFAHVKASKTTGAARALDSRITTSFMDELEGRELIKYTDVK